MRLSLLLRKLHRWGALLVAIPLLLTVVSGVLLQMQDRADRVDLATRPVTEGPSIVFGRVLEAAMAVPEAEVESWEDIEHVAVRPAGDVLEIRTGNRTEIQLDGRSGEVLAIARSRAGLIRSIHDGSFFGELVRAWIFLPATVLLVGLWVTGVYMALLPCFNRRAGARRAGAAGNGRSAGRAVPRARGPALATASFARAALAGAVLGAVTLGASIRSVGFATLGTATFATGAGAAAHGSMVRPADGGPRYVYQPVEIADFDAHVGRLVRVRTIAGEVQRDELVAVEPERIVLRRSRAAGHELYALQRSAVEQVEVLARSSHRSHAHRVP